MSMTLERSGLSVGWAEEHELRETHLRQLAEMFEGRHGAERARMANNYAALLLEFERDARAIRNVEVLRIADRGAGPAEIGRLFGVVRQRGEQIINSAASKRAEDEGRVRSLRSRIAARRREG